MARTFLTPIPRSHLATVRAVRVGWPVPDTPHLPAKGSTERTRLDRFVAKGAPRDVLVNEEVRIAYEVFDAKGQTLGLVWRPVMTGIGSPGEWLTYKMGRYVGTPRPPYRYPRSLTEAVQELARREHKRLQEEERVQRRAVAREARAELQHG